MSPDQEPSTGPGPGWYDDPDVPGGKRFYDGNSWTDQRTPPPQQPMMAMAPAQQTKTSGMAIASLVLGLVWIYGLGSVLAIIFGFVAKKNIRESNGFQTGGGMATAGIVLGIIGAALLAIIIIAAASSDSGGYGGYNY